MRAPERAVVLAAGLGTRLKWLSRRRPKALMPLGAEAAIERVIRALVAQGVRWIAVNAHAHAQALISFLGHGERFGCALRISLEPTLLDSGAGCVRALSLLPLGEDPIVVHNADAIFSPWPSLARLGARLLEGGAVLVLADNPRSHPEGDCFVAEDGRISFERPIGPRLTYTGLSCWHPAALQGLPAQHPWPLAERMRTLAAQGRLFGVVHRGSWQDIGRPADWWRTHRRLHALR